MNKLTGNFIKNAGKSTEKPVVEYNAYTSKPERHSDRFKVTREDVYWIVSWVMICGFITWMVT